MTALGETRFEARWPEGMCVLHRQYWIDYRDMYFDPVTGNRWPGVGGSMFTVIGPNLDKVREERKIEWDEKALSQMHLIEQICLSGTSPQCEGDRIYYDTWADE